jgi:dephospho-CoA kinase
MSRDEAERRIMVQTPQDEKIKSAHVVIENDGTFENTWRQVVAAWRTLIPVMESPVKRPIEVPAGEITVHRARPQEAEEIARFIAKITQGMRRPTRSDVMAAFGEQAYMVLTLDKKNGWITWLAGGKSCHPC